ncbi:MAG: glycosyltransferase family 2 protein [Bacteroidota bacterium]|nr:glycosyltransferase family 2 protein [Bacteroidota bacterium]
MRKRYDLSIVLPMYKPKAGWEKSLKENMQLLDIEFNYSISIEYVLVNDGFENEHLLSLFDVIQQSENNVRFISYAENMGKGFALRTGVAAASASVVITTDLDFPYESKDLRNVYALLTSGNEIVTGKRKAEYYAATPFKRRLISKACIAMNKHLLKLSLGDAQSGLKGFNKKGKKVFLQTTINRFLVDTEFLVLANKQKLDIAVLELNLKNGIKFSTMGWKILLAESKNFYQIIKMNRSGYSPAKEKKYAEPKGVVNL